MPGFNYTAYDANGDIVSGEIEAESKTAAMEMLALQDMIPDKVKETKEGGTRGFSLFGVKSGDLILYAKQFRTLIAAGIGIIQVFNVLEVQTENRVLKRATAEMMKAIEKGDTLFKAFSAQSHAFSGLFCAMVRAGETSGTLPDVLERLIYITEHEEKVKNDIRAALRYPVIVMCFLLTSFIVLLTMVVPKFVGIFERAGIALPLPTQICIALYRFMDQYWPMIILATAGTILFLIRFAKTPGGRLIFHSLMLRMPIIGPVLVKSAMSRFASIFSILQASGITVLDAMTILANTINNAAIERELDKIRTLMEEGRGISGPLSRARYFTPMVIHMVAIGEESGSLDDMLREVAGHYDAEVEYATKGLSDSLGPILMVGLAAVVGFFAAAIFLPMWDLTKIV